jgi:putative endonuclease
MTRKLLGSQGEHKAALYLEAEGFSLIARNIRSPYGEVDLVVGKGNVIAFVEVKTRTKTYFDLSQVITKTKQQRIIKTAQVFIQKNSSILGDGRVFRFDVVLVEPEQITHLENAFEAYKES